MLRLVNEEKSYILEVNRFALRPERSNLRAMSKLSSTVSTMDCTLELTVRYGIIKVIAFIPIQKDATVEIFDAISSFQSILGYLQAHCHQLNYHRQYVLFCTYSL